MRKPPQSCVSADSPEDTLVRIRFPQSTRLHDGHYGKFEVPIKGTTLKIMIRPRPILTSILKGLEEDIDDLKLITGDYLTLLVRVKCPAAVDHVVRHTALACHEHNKPFRYQCGRPLTTAKPVYAV